MKRRAGRNLGFTLMEMLIATALVAMLAGSLFVSLHVALAARKSALSAVETVRKTELSVELVRADLQAAMVPKGILAGPFMGTNARDLPGGQGDGLSFYAAVPEAEPAVGAGDIKKIEYSCEPSASDPNDLVLVRRVTTNLLALVTPEPKEEIISRGLAGFTLTYFDGLDWLDSWDSTLLNNVLPKAVEVTLAFKDSPGQPGRLLSEVVLVPCGADSSASADAAASAEGSSGTSSGGAAAGSAGGQTGQSSGGSTGGRGGGAAGGSGGSTGGSGGGSAGGPGGGSGGGRGGGPRR